LGHVISEKGIEVDPSKVVAVQQFPTPTNVRTMHGFIGLCSYYRRFVKDFAKIASPLHNLLKLENSFNWTPECQLAFDKMKHLLYSAPILAFPDFDKAFKITTDASGTGLGCILSQEKEGSKPTVVAYASRTLQKAERNYSATEKECLAIVWAVKLFRSYLHGKKFKIESDHRSLQWLFNMNDPGGKLQHWGLKLQEYQYEITY